MSAPGLVLAVAVLGTFMAFVDATIVNIAVPDIAQHFAAPLTSVSWVLNAYNIVFAAFLVGGGQLADLLGRRRVFTGALLAFTGASALCALAPSLDFLVAARALQAAGAAALVPSSLAIVLAAHDSDRRMHAVALWSAVAALAAGIGPPLGGLLITASSWRLVFLVNVPVGLVAFVLAQRVLIESRAPGRRRLPDLLGGGVFAVAVALLVLAIVKGEEWGWTSARVLGSLLAALLLGAYFVVRSSRERVPMIDLSLLRIRAFSISNAATIVMATGFYAYTLCNVLFLTEVWQYSILTAGLALTPGPITAIAIATPASRAVERFGRRTVLVPGALIWAAGMVYFATTLGTHPDFLGQWLAGMLILGLGAGLTFPTLSGAAVGAVPGPRFAVATSLNSVARQLGAAVGVAILIAIIGTPAPSEALEAFQHGWLFAAGCFVVGGLACLGVVLDAHPEEQLSDAPREDERERRAGERATAPALPHLTESVGEQAQVAAQSDADFLLNIPIFSALTEGMRERIATLAETVRLTGGEWLFRAGDEADGVYVVRVGHLEVLAESAEEQPERINTLTRGAVLGELALLNGSRRSASIRAMRDSELLRIERGVFESLLRSEPELALSLTAALSAQLQASRAIPPERRAEPVTIALRALTPGVELLDLADELSRAICSWGTVAVLYPDEHAPERPVDDAAARALLAPLIDSCEERHDKVIMVCGEGEPSAWDQFCVSRADLVLGVVAAADSSTRETPPSTTSLAGMGGAGLIALGFEVGAAQLEPWVQALSPSALYTVQPGSRDGDVERIARRLCGRSVGVVLSGGGARAFAHLGVLEVLLDAGLTVDRVGGVSMGAFIGALLASGHDSASIDAICFEEWVRRNPINDYTLPRSSLIRGHKAEAMLDRVFGEARIEELARTFYCASVNLRGGHLVIDSAGLLVETVGASISLPLIAPPIRRGDALLIDGSLLDNLPLEPMSASGEGPVLAIDVKGGEERAEAKMGAPAPPRAPRRQLPLLPETMGRVALLSSANTDASAGRHADVTIAIRVGGVGLLEFHQIDAAREAGRARARAALEGAPAWLLGNGHASSASTARRTVIRV